MKLSAENIRSGVEDHLFQMRKEIYFALNGAIDMLGVPVIGAIGSVGEFAANHKKLAFVMELSVGLGIFLTACGLTAPDVSAPQGNPTQPPESAPVVTENTNPSQPVEAAQVAPPTPYVDKDNSAEAQGGKNFGVAMLDEVLNRVSDEQKPVIQREIESQLATAYAAMPWLLNVPKENLRIGESILAAPGAEQIPDSVFVFHTLPDGTQTMYLLSRRVPTSDNSLQYDVLGSPLMRERNEDTQINSIVYLDHQGNKQTLFESRGSSKKVTYHLFDGTTVEFDGTLEFTQVGVKMAALESDVQLFPQSLLPKFIADPDGIVMSQNGADFQLNVTNGRWEKVEYAPMDLGTPENPAQCTRKDFKGRIQAQENATIVPFAGGEVGNWSIVKSRDGYSPWYSGPLKIVSYCTMSSDEIDPGLPADQKQTLTVIGFQLADNSVVHLTFDKSMIAKVISNGALKPGTEIGIMNLYDKDALDNFVERHHAWTKSLLLQNNSNGAQRDAISALLNQGKFSEEGKKMLFSARFIQ